MGYSKCAEDNEENAYERYTDHLMQQEELEAHYSGTFYAAPFSAEINVSIIVSEKPVQTAQRKEKLICRKCNSTFSFTKGEQKFFEERGFVPPKHCPTCRKLRRALREGEKSA